MCIRGEARARVIALGSSEMVAVVKTNHGDYHELKCTDLIDAFQTVARFCGALGLHLMECVADDECRAVNCGGGVLSRIAEARNELNRRNGREGSERVDSVPITKRVHARCSRGVRTGRALVA